MAVVAARAVALAAANFASTLIAGAQALGLMALNAARAAASMALMAARVIIVNAALLAARIATLAWAAAMAILNVATGPIGLIVIAIIALIAVIILAWKHSETFRNIVIGAWNAVRAFISAAVSFIINFIKSHWLLIITIIGGPLGLAVGLVIKYWSQIRSFISTAVNFVVNFVRNHWQLLLAIIGGPLGIIVGLVIKHWSSIKNFIVSVNNSIVSFIRGAMARVRGAISAVGSIVGTIAGIFNRFNNAVISRVNSAVNFVRRVPGWISGVFSGAGSWLWNAGARIIQGLIDGVQSKINQFLGMLRNLTDLIPKVKGPKRKDMKLLTPAGQHIMDGLIKGIAKKIPALQSLLSGVTTTVIQNGPIQKADAGHLEFRAKPTVLQTGSLIDWNKLTASLANELKKNGVGATYLDGKLVSSAIGRIQGQATANQRRTR
jgi:phage-related protein